MLEFFILLVYNTALFNKGKSYCCVFFFGGGQPHLTGALAAKLPRKSPLLQRQGRCRGFGMDGLCPTRQAIVAHHVWPLFRLWHFIRTGKAD